MFYIVNVITFSVFWELLWKSTLLVCYRLNRLRPPLVNQFDICAQLIQRLRQVHNVILSGHYRYWKPTLWQLIDVTIIFCIVSFV